MARLFYLSAVAALLFCCQSPDEPVNKFADPGLLKIADLQDRRLADSLYPFFSHPDARYRRDAVRAFGSLQRPGEVEKIGRLLLMDPDAEVRKAASFALGQIQDPACERILLGALVKEKVPAITAEILQAYGKTTKRWQLDPGVFGDDSLRTAAVAWSLYRAGLRGKTDTTANAVAIRLLDQRYNERARLGAAHYFASAAKDFGKYARAIRRAAQTDPSTNVRMAAALALGKIASDSALHTLKEIIKSESDSRVVVNAIRALGAFPFKETRHYLYQALQHKDVHVGVAASGVIVENIPADAWIEVSSLINRVDHWRIIANLYEAALKAGQNKDLAVEIEERFAESQNPYQRAALLGSLRYFPESYPFVVHALREADTAVVRSAAAAALVAMNKTERFPSTFKRAFAGLYQELLRESDDPAVLGTIASALADSTLGYRQYIKDLSSLQAAEAKLKLPQDNEALQSVEAARAFFEGREPVTVRNAFNHPIDWNLVRQVSQNQRATIRTSRGSIVIALKVNEAPGSVANFIALAQADYFDSLSIHRVVPNFVIQGGCKRGDGWGSEDYSIRSEFSGLPFRTGSVGMASAGKDTEGTQWFITHSPTPHLDGRYTLFAEVVEGQAVIDYLQVGDQITDVEIGNFTDQ